MERLERHSGRGERGEHVTDGIAGAERKQRMALEKRNGLARRIDRVDNDLRIRRRLQPFELGAAQRRKREGADGLDNPVEFKSLQCQHFASATYVALSLLRDSVCPRGRSVSSVLDDVMVLADTQD